MRRASGMHQQQWEKMTMKTDTSEGFRARIAVIFLLHDFCCMIDRAPHTPTVDTRQRRSGSTQHGGIEVCASA